MSDAAGMEQSLVFGLDIGTRNVVGTVGYRDEDTFIVVAQQIMEHETRAMLDGQIHDIGRVGRTIRKMKEKLEAQVEVPLTEVCIAAAGRVLKTVTTNVVYDFPEETVVTGEDIHTLDLLGIEKAQNILQEMNDTKYKFYCVGYSVMKYFLNDEPFSSIESHKADRIAEDIIVTFLPEDVVDGLYAAVAQADLTVANLTLEPIAAINVAIPENYRLLNIALVDIGAGTSDISITKDGSIIAYGMIPLAGDELTELIVQHYLVDFKTAEYIKLQSSTADKITYKDIMLIEHTIPSKEVWDLTAPVVEKMTTEVAAKIKELNGEQTVSAAFIVGGGGKIHGYTEMLAEKLDLPKERVALRGEEVLQEVVFEQKDIEKDPLLVTPIGICLNYYEQRNGFILVRFNGERQKLYNNNNLTIVDAALQAGFPNEDLFPKRGQELEFTVNGAKRIVRGEPGESAAVYMNGRMTNINTPLEPNCDIIIEPSTTGTAAVCTLEQLEEYSADSVAFVVNGNIIRCPKFLEVNGSLELPSYEIKQGDQVETRSFYTVGQLAEFMDVEVSKEHVILVNNREANFDTLIYENFTIEWTVISYKSSAYMPQSLGMDEDGFAEENPEGSEETVGKGENVVESGATAGNHGSLAENGAAAGKEGSLVETGAAGKGENVAEAGAAGKDGSFAEAGAAGKEESFAETGAAGQGESFVESGAAVGKDGSFTEIGAAGQGESFVEGGAAAGKDGSFTETGAAGNQAENPISEEFSNSQKPVNGKLFESKAESTAFNGTAAQSQVPDGSVVGKISQDMVQEIKQSPGTIGILVYINGQPVRLTGKQRYVFVDIFDFYNFDLKEARGRNIITNLNGKVAQYSAELQAGDEIELGWEEK